MLAKQLENQGSNTVEIHGFAGKMGAGKNFVAETIFQRLLPPKNTLVMALADHFKIEAVVMDGLDYHRVYGQKDEESRKYLQHRGTELGRDKYGQDVWVKILDTWIKRYQETGIERVIITDIRFENEAKWLKQRGGMLYIINAPQRNLDRLKQESQDDPEKISQLQSHPSEAGIVNLGKYADYTINNDYSDADRVWDRIRMIVKEDIIFKQKIDKVILCDLDLIINEDQLDQRIAGLRELKSRGKVVVYTQGDRVDQMSTMIKLGLTSVFDCHVVSPVVAKERVIPYLLEKIGCHRYQVVQKLIDDSSQNS